MKQTETVAFKTNNKRDSKSRNDFNRSLEGKWARHARHAFQVRKNALREQYTF